MTDTIDKEIATTRAPALVCGACGHTARPIEVYPFSCPQGQHGDEEHLLGRWMAPGSSIRIGNEDNPFLRYRWSTRAYEAAIAGGLSDGEYIALVNELDEKLAQVSGESGLLVTPFERCNDLSDVFGSGPTGGIWIKDETRGVGGTHKLRQLYGILLYIEVIDHLGLAALESTDSKSLVLEGSGQDAYAGALLARASGRNLTAFVPGGITSGSVERAREHGATVTECVRTFDGSGDARLVYLKRTLAGGALPFTCDTTFNALALEGATLLGYEMIAEITRTGLALDHLFVQVGRGTLAAGIVQAWQDTANAGSAVPAPRLYPVHLSDNHPLLIGYERLIGRLVRRLEKCLPKSEPACPKERWGRAEWVRQRLDLPVVEEEFAFVRANPSVFSSVWHNRPQTAAAVFQRDEVREWYKILEGVVYSGGFPVRVDEQDLKRASELNTLWIHGRADISGSSGLAGFLSFLADEQLESDSRIGVVLSGRDAN